MSTPLKEAQQALNKARLALLKDDRRQARQWAERAARLAPQLEDPWLVLAAVAGPRGGLEYIQRALQVNPDSPRAKRGMEWVMERLQEPQLQAAQTQRTPRTSPRHRKRSASRPRRNPALAMVLLALGCMVLGFAGWSASSSPVVASIIARPVQAADLTHPPSWAQASIPKPTYTPTALVTDAVVPAATATPGMGQIAAEGQLDLSTRLSTELPTDLPTASGVTPDAEAGIPMPEPTWSGSLSLEYVADTPTPDIPDYTPTLSLIEPDVGSEASGTHWIEVDLTQQMVYAHAGDAVVNSFVVSTGTWMTPTVTGEYKIYVKLRYSDMTGADYYLPDVPYVMYFYKDYGLHGTYWHSNFGTPMSHGCVNLSIPDAEWLYNFSNVGTAVNVHY